MNALDCALKHCSELRAQLAASQTRERVLREAMEVIALNIGSTHAATKAKEALSTVKQMKQP